MFLNAGKNTSGTGAMCLCGKEDFPQQAVVNTTPAQVAGKPRTWKIQVSKWG